MAVAVVEEDEAEDLQVEEEAEAEVVDLEAEGKYIRKSN